MAVELVRAALAQAAAAAASAGGANGAAATADDGESGSGSGGLAAAEAAEAVALEVAADDRLLESLVEEVALRHQLAGLLYNHALLCLHSGRASDAGLAFFSAALPLLGDGDGDGDGPHPADCRRAQALCAMAASQHDRWSLLRGGLLPLARCSVFHCSLGTLLSCTARPSALDCRDNIDQQVALRPSASLLCYWVGTASLQGAGVFGSGRCRPAGCPAHRHAAPVGAPGRLQQRGRGCSSGSSGGMPRGGRRSPADCLL